VHSSANAGRVPTPGDVGTVSFIDGTFDVALAWLDVGGECARALSAVLSNAERERAGRFKFARDRQRFIVARARLRELLATRLGVRPEAVEFVYGSHGKPELGPHCAASGLCFNVAHAQDLAIYAFSTGRAIGVDVERIRAIDDADDIAARFFTRRENDAYRALDPRERLLGFFNCWTRKEAFVKALGDGLSHSLGDFDVSLAPGEPAKLLRVGAVRGEQSGWSLCSFSPAPGFVGAVVVGSRMSSLSRHARSPDSALETCC
jgi:4'-phosphopantetheinyl transferase